MGEAGEPVEITGVRRFANSSYGALHLLTREEGFIWKPMAAGRHCGGSEVAARRLSRLLGLPFVPPVWVVETGAAAGTLTGFVEGAATPAGLAGDSELRRWRKAYLRTETFAGHAAQMVAFDALLGNRDRHADNWLVDGQRRRIWWIDHGSASWAGGKRVAREGLKKLGNTLKSLGFGQAELARLLHRVARNLADLPPERLRSWQKISPWDWGEALVGLPARLRDAAEATSWATLQGLITAGGLKLPEGELEKILKKVERWEPRSGPES